MFEVEIKVKIGNTYFSELKSINFIEGEFNQSSEEGSQDQYSTYLAI